MSKENLERFYELVRQDKSLQAHLKPIADASQFAEAAVRLGAERGCTFTTEDVKKPSIEQVLSQDGQLSESRLETVAGGIVSSGIHVEATGGLQIIDTPSKIDANNKVGVATSGQVTVFGSR